VALEDPLLLVARPWAFSQQWLLDAEEFARMADERDVSVPPPALERLQRAGMLQPLFIVTRPPWDIRKRRRARSWGEMNARRWSPSKDGQGLAEDVKSGRVADGAKVTFRAWSRDVVRTSIGDVFRRREHLYSPYQLLALPNAAAALGLISGRGGETTHGPIRRSRPYTGGRLALDAW
jgi:hypothetical protein